MLMRNNRLFKNSDIRSASVTLTHILSAALIVGSIFFYYTRLFDEDELAGLTSLEAGLTLSLFATAVIELDRLVTYFIRKNNKKVWLTVVNIVCAVLAVMINLIMNYDLLGFDISSFLYYHFFSDVYGLTCYHHYCNTFVIYCICALVAIRLVYLFCYVLKTTNSEPDD